MAGSDGAALAMAATSGVAVAAGVGWLGRFEILFTCDLLLKCDRPASRGP
jgi:hypothetical protein